MNIRLDRALWHAYSLCGVYTFNSHLHQSNISHHQQSVLYSHCYNYNLRPDQRGEKLHLITWHVVLNVFILFIYVFSSYLCDRVSHGGRALLPRGGGGHGGGGLHNSGGHVCKRRGGRGVCGKD